MGLLDRVKDFFSGSKGQEEPQRGSGENLADKRGLIEEIRDLKRRVMMQNSFNNTARNVSEYGLEHKSIEELTGLRDSLKRELDTINRNGRAASAKEQSDREAREAARWTGKAPDGISENDLKRAQNWEH